MRPGEVVALLLVLSFAVAVTVHASLVYGLAHRKPRWRALVALVIPFMAPLWGWREHRKRSVAWVVAVVTYLVVRVLANR